MNIYTQIQKGEEGNKDFVNVIQRTAPTVNYFNTLKHQVIGILLFKQRSHPRSSILKTAIPYLKPPVTKEGAKVSLHILTICQDGAHLPVWAILISKEPSNHI